MCVKHIKQLDFIEYYAEIRITVKSHIVHFIIYFYLQSMDFIESWTLVLRSSRNATGALIKCI